jgi:competence protein ComEC
VIEFDTVSAKDGEVVAEWIANGTDKSFDEFGLLRVTTTLSKFAELARDIADPQPGFWYHLKLDPKHSGGGMRAWFAGPTEFGFSALSKGRIVEAERLVSSIDPAPRPASLGAASVPARILPPAIANACRVPSRISRITAQDVLARIPQCDSALVHDVGQGSFTTLLKAGRPCLHFDVGSPTAFNGKSARKAPLSVDMNNRVPVLLSHWDWDHFHAAFQIPSLRRCRWIVPDQILGPAAAKLAQGLNKAQRLYVWNGGTASFELGDVGACTGMGRNGTGLVLNASLSDGRNILLVGDADYDYLPFSVVGLAGLVAPHHGGRSHSVRSTPPTPIGNCSYIVSYGTPNVYQHPHIEALDLHARAGWQDPVRTAGFNGVARGDRTA